MRLTTAMALLLASYLLGACGQTDPLYLPGEEQPSREEGREQLPDLVPGIIE